MAIIDVVKWDGTPDIFAWKFPENNLSTKTQLIVHQTQEAVLFSKGKLVSKFDAGKHTLSTENIPILRELYEYSIEILNPDLVNFSIRAKANKDAPLVDCKYCGASAQRGKCEYCGNEL